MNLRNTEEDGTVTNDFAVPIETIRDILTFIGFKNAPYAEMMNALGYAKSLFYPTDERVTTRLLLLSPERIAHWPRPRQRQRGSTAVL